MKIGRVGMLLVGAVVGSLAAGTPSWAKDCGNGIGIGGADVPCACGDTVVASRVLVPSVDPVVSTSSSDVCLGDGLVMNTSGVLLNLAGAQIRGNQSAGHVGIRVLGTVDDIEIRNGRVNRFVTGIFVDGTMTGSTIRNIDTKNNVGDGINVTGEDNALSANKTNLNGGDGLVVTGNGNTLDGIQSVRNTGTGIVVTGDDNDVSLSQVNQNDAGLLVTGSDNTIRKNKSFNNKNDGILVGPTGNTDGGRNTGTRNGGVQCQIDGVACQ